MSDFKISIRPAVAADLPYLKPTLINSFRDGEGARAIPDSFFKSYEEKILRKILPRCSKAGGILVAYETLDADADFDHIIDAPILGYIVSEPLQEGLLVHYVYVRGHNKSGGGKVPNYRNRGIGTALVRAAQRKFSTEGESLIYTYRTRPLWEVPELRAAIKREGAVYCPYLKYSLLPAGWETGK